MVVDESQAMIGYEALRKLLGKEFPRFASR